MSLLRRAELRLGLCPARIVLRDQILATTTLDALKGAVGRRAAAAVILSNHFVRYIVLPPTNDLGSEAEWMAYAAHEFAATYGNESAGWRIRICATGRCEPRVACAVDSALLDSLRDVPGVVSVQPYLMAAFNARRGTLRGKTGWFVLQEPGRLTVSLFREGIWKVIRTRQIPGDWRPLLADLLDRETAASGEPYCDRVVICCEEEIPAELGRYRVCDASLPSRVRSELRPYIMALN